MRFQATAVTTVASLSSIAYAGLIDDVSNDLNGLSSNIAGGVTSDIAAITSAVARISTAVTGDIGALSTGIAGGVSAIKSEYSDIKSDVDTILNKPAFQSVISDIESQTTELAKLKSLGLAGITDLTSFIESLATEAPSVVSSVEAALPSDAKDLVTGVLADASSVASKAGSVVTGISTKTSSSTSATASATGSGAVRDRLELGLLAGALMGVVGVMALL